MTRTLTFAPEDARKFELTLTGFVLGGNVLNQNTARPAHERKKEAKILRGLKFVSEPAAAATDEFQRTLKAAGGQLTLEQDQHDLLVKYVEACPFLTQVSDQVDELLDWLHAAPREP